MNKFGMVLGVATVVTLAGCKDPDYVHGNAPESQNAVKTADPVAIETAAVPKCTCLPGTKHTSPCKCGAPDCKCTVEVKPIIVADVSKPSVAKPVAVKPVVAEPEYTIYVVQNGDYLAKISKKFNVTIASIKRLNPSIKKDVVRVGQKLKLPGKFDVGVQAVPVAAAKKVATSAKKTAKAAYAPYTGATKEYVVKNGDTLGSVAYGNGINIRQLKAMNGLSSDTLKIGQKLKIPAEKVEKDSAAVAPAVKKVEAATPVKTAAAAPATEAAPAAAAETKQSAVPTVEAAPVVEAAPAAAKADVAATAPAAVEATPAAAPATTTYVVQEGDDMTGVSIRWGVSAAEVRELNNLGENDQLVPGQILKLPAEAQQ